MTKRPTDPDRRQSLRVSVDLWVEERTGEATYFQRATNLSLGGVFLHGTLPHPAGTRVALDLKLEGRAPGGPETVAVQGEVVLSTGGSGMGIRFVDLSPAARRSIDAACTRRARPSVAEAPRQGSRDRVA